MFLNLGIITKKTEVYMTTSDTSNGGRSPISKIHQDYVGGNYAAMHISRISNNTIIISLSQGLPKPNIPSIDTHL